MRGRAGGYALVLLLAMFSVLAALTVGAWSTTGGLARAKGQQTAMALEMAKQGLVAYAATASTPGQLPCPEDSAFVGTSSEGQAAASCSNTKVTVGRLPWRTLGLGDLRDGNGDRLWYVLGPGFRSAPINSNALPGLTVDGSSAVALAISPGPATPQQQRLAASISQVMQVGDYLDGINGALGSNYTRAENDLISMISLRELMQAVERRVLSEVSRGLWDYYCGVGNWQPGGGCTTTSGGQRRFPLPAAVSDTGCLGTASITASSGKCPSGVTPVLGRIPANPSPNWTAVDVLSLLRGTTGSGSDWFQKNGWRELIFYRVAGPCVSQACSGSGDWLELVTATGRHQTALKLMLLSAGPIQGSQQRSTTSFKTNLKNYLEGAYASDASPLFQVLSSSLSNDLLRGLP